MTDILSMNIKEKVSQGEKLNEKTFKIDKEEIRFSKNYSLKNISYQQVFTLFC